MAHNRCADLQKTQLASLCIIPVRPLPNVFDLEVSMMLVLILQSLLLLLLDLVRLYHRDFQMTVDYNWIQLNPREKTSSFLIKSFFDIDGKRKNVRKRKLRTKINWLTTNANCINRLTNYSCLVFCLLCPSAFAFSNRI